VPCGNFTLSAQPKSFTAKAAKKSLDTKDTKDTKGKNSLTAKNAKAAKKSIIKSKPQGREGNAPNSV